MRVLGWLWPPRLSAASIAVAFLLLVGALFALGWLHSYGLACLGFGLSILIVLSGMRSPDGVRLTSVEDGLLLRWRKPTAANWILKSVAGGFWLAAILVTAVFRYIPACWTGLGLAFVAVLIDLTGELRKSRAIHVLYGTLSDIRHLTWLLRATAFVSFGYSFAGLLVGGYAKDLVRSPGQAEWGVFALISALIIRAIGIFIETLTDRSCTALLASESVGNAQTG